MNEYAAPEADLRDEAGTMPDADERQWAMFAHLSILSLYLTGFGYLIGPIVVWLLKRDASAFVDESGKEAVNFALSCTIWLVASIAMAFTIVLLPVAFLIWIAGGLYMTVLCVIAGVKANEGTLYRYPLTFRLLR